MSRLVAVRSVRFRITMLASVLVAIVLTAVGVALLVVQERQLYDSLDDALGRRADEVLGGEVGRSTDEVVVLPSGLGDEIVVQVVSVDGDVLSATENAVGESPIAEAPADGGESYTTVGALPIEDDEYRILSRWAVVEGASVVVHVAESTDDLRDVLGQLQVAVAIAIPIAVLVLGGSVWWLVGRTLRPVEQIRSEVAGFGPGQLERRVSSPGTGDEIDRLADTMNEMLDRVEEAGLRQQRFVADASHELRGPLTRMRIELETAGGQLGGDVDPSTARSVIAEIDQLTSLVDDLLVLARSDAGRAPQERRRVDLDDLVFDEVAAVRRSATAVSVDVGGVSGAEVLGEPGELRRVVRNLLDNAVRHAATRVDVTLAELGVEGDAGSALLTVTDDGPGIPADRAEAVFERFTRLDDARTPWQGSGTGLGLAIARDIVERHGGSLAVDLAHSDGARFVVQLPVDVTRS